MDWKNMKFTRKMLATSTIGAAGAAALAVGLSATAAAEPAAVPPPAPSVPGLPGLPFLQQLATNPAAATQLIQGLTSMLGSAQTAATPAPAAAAPRRRDPGSRCHAGTGTRRNGVGHSSAACGSGRSPGPCDRAGHRGAESAPLGRDEYSEHAVPSRASAATGFVPR